MHILLDTNAYSGLMCGDRQVLNTLESATQITFSYFVYAELLTGFKRGSRERANLEILGRFLAKPSVTLHLPTRDTADYYAEIRKALLSKGRPIPANDVWIAAQCLEHGAQLISYDKHFTEVSGLRLWKILPE